MFCVRREAQRKVNMVWHSNGTVSYQREKYWYFDRSLSVGPLSDVITTINVPVVGSAEFVRGSFFMEWSISDMLSTLEATIFVKKTVEELLFEGYEDTVMELGSTFADDSEGDYYEDYDNDNYTDEDDEWDYNDDGEEEEKEEKKVEDDAKENVILDKFGWFYKVCSRAGSPTLH